jgi:hypothetical protein
MICHEIDSKTSLKGRPFKKLYMFGTDCELGNFNVIIPYS